MRNDGQTLVSRLRVGLAGRPGSGIDDPEAAQAAVAIVLSPGNAPEILFIRRRERAGDPWSGHMAFPGGFRSTSDADLEVTARRETAEETGLDLAADAELLGTLDDVAPRSIMLPRIVVRPFVYAAARVPALVPSDEVAEALWLRVDALFDPAHRVPLALDLPIGPRTFESIQIDGYTIWGLTERILASMTERL